MRQSKKLVFLATLLVGLPIASDATVTVSTTTTNTGTVGIAGSVVGAVTIQNFAPNAGDLTCMAVGPTATALLTSANLEALGGFGSKAELWANMTGVDPATLTDADGTAIAGLTGDTDSGNFSANMTRDIMLGCSVFDQTVSGDATSAVNATSGNNQVYTITMNMRADALVEEAAVNVHGTWRTGAAPIVNADAPKSSATPFAVDLLRPQSLVSVTGADVGAAVVLNGFGGAADIEATEFEGEVTVNTFNTGTFATAGIGATINMNVNTTVEALDDIVGNDKDHLLKADFGLGSEFTFYSESDPSFAGRRSSTRFNLLHTIVGDQAKGTVLGEAQVIGTKVTFWVEDGAGNKSSLTQADLVDNPLTAVLNVVIANKSHQLVAADVGGLVATTGKISRGAVGDVNGLTFAPAATPTMLNLTAVITDQDGKTLTVVHNNATRDHANPDLGQGSAGFVFDLTTPATVGGAVTAPIVSTDTGITDGTWSLTVSGVDAANNPVLPITIADLTSDTKAPGLANFSPVFVAGQLETGPDAMIARGTNSEVLSSASITLVCDVVTAGQATTTALGWPLTFDGALVEVYPKAGGVVGGVVIPTGGPPASNCAWTWTAVDANGNAGTVTSNALAPYNPAALPSVATQLVLTNSVTTQTAGGVYDVQVQVRDSGNLPVFGISSSSEAGDIVTLCTDFTPGSGACAFGTDCSIVFSGTSVTDAGDNTCATLDLTKFASDASLNVTVTAKSVGSNVFDGLLSTTNSTGTSAAVATTVAALDALRLGSVNATVGENFWVDVDLVDVFGNIRTADGEFVEVSTNANFVSFPSTAIKIAAGAGGFWASSNHVGDITWWARGLTSTEEGMLVQNINGDVAPAGAPTGGDVPNDQGNFVYLTIPVSPAHAYASQYRIWRTVEGVGSVSWATVDAIPGATELLVILYVPDINATPYGVTVEVGNQASVAAKQAFAATQGIGSQYELMAETMMQSKQALEVTPGAPIFATLTPDAIGLINGVVPSFKVGGDVRVSDMMTSQPIRAIDNIAPAALTTLQAVDTPSDAGGSISVTWNKSLDDRLLAQNTSQALGAGGTSTVAGVIGYNIYRKAGDSDFALVSNVPAGVTNFEDNTVFNGQRYTYSVSPFDADNVTSTELERTSMAIRNNVRDASGNFVMGLFGADNSVGFDDFFIFADFFGQTAADAAFDPAFDLSPNNRVDLDDFFVFADYFGRNVASSSRVVPMLAGLNSNTNLTLDAGAGLPGIGEEMIVTVGLENFVELQGYGLSLAYDSEVLEFVGSRVGEDNLLGEAALALPQVINLQDGKASIFALGETAVNGDLGLSLVFRTKLETEGSYIEITDGLLRDGNYGVNSLRGPASVMIETRPEVYALNDNYPNPFNPETTIKYQLPEAGLVTLEVYNMLGQVVKTLVSENQTAGRKTVQWDATNDNGQSLSSGMYFYHVEAGEGFQDTKKMLLLK